MHKRLINDLIAHRFFKAITGANSQLEQQQYFSHNTILANASFEQCLIMIIFFNEIAQLLHMISISRTDFFGHIAS